MLKNREIFVEYASNYSGHLAKDALIVNSCRNKTVLDLGCIDHSAETAIGLGDDWLHKQIKNVAKDVVGVDILSEEARKLNELGYHIVVSDINELDLETQFDVIVAGDLIEHLSNIGRFLDVVDRHMHKDSICIVTTPNPFNIEQAMLAIFHNRIAVNRQHTCWLDPRVMHEMVSRSNLEIKDFHWVDTRFVFPVQRRGWKTIVNWLSGYLMERRPILRRDYAVVLSKTLPIGAEPAL